MAIPLISGCNFWDRGDDTPSSPGDSLSSEPLARDSGGMLPVGGGETAAGDSTGTERGAQPPVDSPSVLVPDTAQPPMGSQASTDIEDRLGRLEAENDSLRVTVGTLMTVLASGESNRLGVSPDSTPPDSSRVTSVTGQLQLTVDARRVGHWGIRIALAILFITLAGAAIRMVVWVLDRLAERNAKNRLFFKRLVPIARISLWFLAILFCSLVILNIQAQGLVAAGAAVGVAVGFAAQDIIKNIFGGIIVLFDQPFQVGDKISVGGTYGEVVSIGLRSTRIVTPDDNLVSVPNSQVVDGQVANANSGELNCQVVTDLYLPGWIDEAQAKRIAFEAATSSKYVYLNKPIVVLVKDEFKEIFLTHLKVKAYVLDPRYEFLFMSDVTERARVGFRKAGLIGPMHGVRAYIDLDRIQPGEKYRTATGEVEE